MTSKTRTKDAPSPERIAAFEAEQERQREERRVPERIEASNPETPLERLRSLTRDHPDLVEANPAIEQLRTADPEAHARFTTAIRWTRAEARGFEASQAFAGPLQVRLLTLAIAEAALSKLSPVLAPERPVLQASIDACRLWAASPGKRSSLAAVKAARATAEEVERRTKKERTEADTSVFWSVSIATQPSRHAAMHQAQDSAWQAYLRQAQPPGMEWKDWLESTPCMVVWSEYHEMVAALAEAIRDGRPLPKAPTP